MAFPNWRETVFRQISFPGSVISVGETDQVAAHHG
jgi:hypothetical protein